MCSTILCRRRNHDLVSGSVLDSFIELHPLPSDSGLAEAGMLRDVSGGCWVESGYHPSQHELEGNGTNRQDASEVTTHDPDFTNIANVDAFVDQEGRGTCRPLQSLKRAIGANRNVWREFSIGQSCLENYRWTLIPPANDDNYDVNFGVNSVKGSPATPNYTTSTHLAPLNKVQVNGSTDILDQKPLCSSGYPVRAPSTDEVSLTASSDILSPRLMPALVPTPSNAIPESSRSMSDSTCSFDVDEITDCQLWHGGPTRTKSSIRQMWKNLKPGNVKHWPRVSLSRHM